MNKENSKNISVKNTEKKPVKPTSPKLPKAVKLDFQIPDIKAILKTGAQFGHQSKRWNPKMRKFIFAKRGNIHIIDLSQSIPLLQEALQFLVNASSQGRVLFVGTKRQAADVVREQAISAGAYYITHRWPGGMMTNFKMILRSLKRLQKLEKDFDEGIHGRTKYEVSVMKKNWERLNRLYGGVKTMDRKPKAIVIVDTNYEINAVKEAQAMGIPIVAMIDTNCDPEGIDYPIPANDDAIQSILLFVELFKKAVLQGNEGHGVTHILKDYSKEDVKFIKQEIEQEEVAEVKVESNIQKPIREPKAPIRISGKSKKSEKKGTLGRSREVTREIKIRAPKSEVTKPKVTKDKDKKKSAEKSQKVDQQDKKDIKFSKRIENILVKEKISHKKLVTMKKVDLQNISGIGEKAADEILKVISKK